MNSREHAGPGADSFNFYEDVGAVDLVAFAEAWVSLPPEVARVIAEYFDDVGSSLPQERNGTPLDLDEPRRLDAIERVGGWSAEIDALLGNAPHAQLPDIAENKGRNVPR